MPADFWLQGKPADVYASLRVVYPAAARERGVHFMNTYMRLKPGVTLAQAQSEMAGIDAALGQEYPDHDAGRVRRLIPLLQSIVGDSRTTLLLLLSAVGLVLLISCVNFASLLLARAASRRRELVIRSSLGAGTFRLVRQMLAESLLLALLGGAAGLLLAKWGIELLLWLKPENLPRLATTHIDARVLAFTFFISLFTGIVFGLIPALHASRLDINSGLKEAGRSGAGGTASLRLRRLLVVTELSLAIVLLIGAGLLIRSFARLASVPPGVAPENIVTMRVELPATRYEKIPAATPIPVRAARFAQRTSRRASRHDQRTSHERRNLSRTTSPSNRSPPPNPGTNPIPKPAPCSAIISRSWASLSWRDAPSIPATAPISTVAIVNQVSLAGFSPTRTRSASASAGPTTTLPIGKPSSASPATSNISASIIPKSPPSTTSIHRTMNPGNAG